MSSPNQLSFLPDDYLENKRQKRTNVICAVLSIVVLAAIGFAFTMADKGLRTEEKLHQEIDRQYTDAARAIEQRRQMEEKQRKMAHQAELTASLLEKVPRSALLAEITNAMPTGVSLLDIGLDSKLKSAPQPSGGKTQFEMKQAAADSAKKQPAGPAVKTYDVSMKVTGIADTDIQVASFIAKLNQSKMLKDVNLVISDEHVINETKMRKFQIEMMINPAAQVLPRANTSATAR